MSEPIAFQHHPASGYKSGDNFECEVWYDPARLRYRRQARQLLREVFERTSREYGLQFSDVNFVTVEARDPRTLQAPIKGWRMMIGRATVIYARPQYGGPMVRLIDRPAHSFLQDLDIKDLDRLRKITRALWRRKYPDKRPHALTIDGIINEMGPKAAEVLLKKAIEGKIG